MRSARVLDSAAAAASSTTTVGFNGIRLPVRPGIAAKARAALCSHGADYRVVRSAGKVSFLIRSPGGAKGRLALTLGPALRRSGAKVVAFRGTTLNPATSS